MARAKSKALEMLASSCRLEASWAAAMCLCA